MAMPSAEEVEEVTVTATAAETSQGSRNAEASPTVYDGSYFQGEGHISYNITGGSRCRGVSGEIRMLGYAWVGPQPPYPTGPKIPSSSGSSHGNPISDTCHDDPDLFRIATTRGWNDWTAHTYGASDVMVMNVSADSTTLPAVRFTATTASDPRPSINAGQGLVRLPGRACSSNEIAMDWPVATVMNGSVTNTTLELRFDGSGNTTSNYKHCSGSGTEDGLRIEFIVTFSGQFDSVNSTKALNIQHLNQTPSWVPNDGSRILLFDWWYRAI
ncbi:hypothetical protein ETB97_009349 [Aspergillus alliaceus]|uniref:Uncharacterized protein n=1 Tax=Petromyces alliaceus TaxID=209559 RepID=A0A8H6E223_PETAA|nr:hypothetical protein ETB97_009349 [Aspergillus burnettii]